MGVMVTITLNQEVTLSSDSNPQSVKIGDLEGTDIHRDGVEITAVFDIPIDEPIGAKDVSVTFQSPEFPANGGLPPFGEFPSPDELPPNGGFPPAGELSPPGGLPPGNGFPAPSDQGLTFIKAGAFEIQPGF